MGYELRGKGDTVSLNIAGWEFIVDVAKAYGWIPMGTQPTDLTYPNGMPLGAQEDWRGSYFYNEWQIITEQDASNIADALQRALQDIPAHSQQLVNCCQMRGRDPAPIIQSLRTPDGLALVMRVIALCRSGRVYIS